VSAILIWGAGAIGGTIGAYLARDGVEVIFVDRDADHVAAMNREGLRIEGPIESFVVLARAYTPAEVSGVYDRIFLCVKAHHTEEATRALAPHLAENGYVVSFQNGLNELVIADIVGKARTVGAFINFGADYMSPGVINYSGRGAFVVGELDGWISPRVQALHLLVQRFEPNAIVTDNILGYLWGKLGYGALLFATALTNASICEGLAAPEPREMYCRLANEAVSVARALHVAPLGFNGYLPEAFTSALPSAASDASFDAMVAHNAKSAKTHSGIWRDLAIRHRATEVDAQLGPIVRFGGEVGVPTPVTRELIAMIHEIESGALPLQWSNLAELDRRAARSAA
jgi:2-dehydropantoate 2-reductase